MYYVRTLDNRPDDIVRDIDEKRLDPVILGIIVFLMLSAVLFGVVLGGFLAYY